ncbi:MAG: globin family protein [Pseudomonadota bacterium]|nr:globin family protein [Pseudomonadota bacterium]
MDDRTIALVKDSFAKVEPIAPTAAEMFYADLFASAPEVRPLFGERMDEQGMKLMSTLGFVVKSLPDLDKVANAAGALALRHVEYGVEPHHYDAVGASLIRTLEQGLGSEFTLEVKEAWLTTYGVLAGVMITTAYGEEAMK